jgi:hypothetical protein
MDNREWIYTRCPSQAQITPEWMAKTKKFLDQTFGKAAKGASDTFYPCSECENKKRKIREVIGQHLCKYGYMLNYTWWVMNPIVLKRRS